MKFTKLLIALLFMGSFTFLACRETAGAKKTFDDTEEIEIPDDETPQDDDLMDETYEDIDSEEDSSYEDEH